MRHTIADDPRRFVNAIRRKGLSIYDPIAIGDRELWIPAPQLEQLLDAGLRGISLPHKPRTRSKAAKQHVCEVLGYPVPNSFKKTKPLARFVGQMFDTYVQKKNNLQIWNDELNPTRRYVLIRVDETDTITKVKVVTGDTLAPLDITGTLTHKYQARCIPGRSPAELISKLDTERLRSFTVSELDLSKIASPVSQPAANELLTIESLFERIRHLVGTTFKDTKSDRNRGSALHALVCKALGYSSYQDDGQFPDVRHQLLEVKLQTSPTIDLGLVTPSSTDALDVPMIGDKQIRHCDTRYAVLYGTADGETVCVSHVFLTTGEAFFGRFPQFQGNVLNKKIQIHLPTNFFDR